MRPTRFLLPFSAFMVVFDLYHLFQFEGIWWLIVAGAFMIQLWVTAREAVRWWDWKHR
jgi:hypothetical protein